MQADEDVGKIAMAVPVLVCKSHKSLSCINLLVGYLFLTHPLLTLIAAKALELFLQDLCDRTYDITLRRGAKTVNSLHL